MQDEAQCPLTTPHALRQVCRWPPATSETRLEAFSGETYRVHSDLTVEEAAMVVRGWLCAGEVHLTLAGHGKVANTGKQGASRDVGDM